MKKTRSKVFSRSISFILIAILLMQSLVLVYAADIDLSVSDPNVPAGSKILSLRKTVSASSDYAPHDAKWSQAFLTDGIIGTMANAPYGWTTNPITDNNQANTAWVVIDLGSVYDLSRIALFPRQDGSSLGECFPIDYYFEFSEDGSNYSGKINESGKTNVGKTTQITDISGVLSARYVRLFVTKRSASLVQISEMAIYGLARPSMTLVKNRLLLKPNDNRKITYTLEHTEESDLELEWSSSNPNFVEVDQLGNIKAKAQGTAIITVKDKLSTLKAECEVIVENEPYDAKKEIMISAFWAPQPEKYINATQYDYLKEANFNYVQNVKTSEITSKSNNLEMARLAYERNMQIGVADHRFGDYLSMTNDEIKSMTEEYADIPGVGGMYVCDEPYNANPYARVLKSIKETSPNFFAYLNFLPSGSYGNETRYRAQLQDFVKLTGASNLDYLMYDRYPFGWTANSLDYTGMLRNMESVWKVGLENDVKTGLYIQSIGVTNGFRRTNENEIRYEVFTALAYGYKQLSYFTWFSPTNRGEDFTPAIISASGEKTDLFDPVKKLNGEVMNLSDTLMNLDAQKVYFAGDNTYNMEKVPSDFFVQPGDNKNMMYSYMRDKTNGRNYLMVVNTSFSEGVSTSLKFNTAITQLQEVVKSSGNSVPVALNNNSVSLDFTPGEGRLFALPENYDFGVDTPQSKDNVNLALNADIDATSSTGSGDFYMRYLTDGKDFSTAGSNGWMSEEFKTAENDLKVTVDLGAVLPFNRVDLYPSGEIANYAILFPKDFKIEVSSDGKTWRTVVNETNFTTPSYHVPVFEFDKTTARYIRLNISKLPYFIGTYETALSEIKVFNDTGLTPVPPTPPTLTNPIEYTPGDNVALNKAIATSSSGGTEVDGWATRFLNDGQKGASATTNGWTSAVGANPTENATEWMAIYLGGQYLVDKLIIYPRSDGAAAGGGFPTDYTVELSSDGISWVNVVDITDESTKDPNPRTFALDTAVGAAFIRFTGTKLKYGGNTRDGYLMQVGEFEAYGNPVCDKTDLNASIASLNAYSQSEFTKSSWTTLESANTYAVAINGKEYATQAEANKAIFDINSAIKKLIERANNADIQSALDSASLLVEPDYTKASWKVLSDAITTAKAIIADDEATLQSGADAVDAINSAKTALIEAANLTELEKVIADAQSYEEEDYTTTTWTALKNAVKIAQALAESQDPTAQEGASAIAAIADAIDGLIEAADKRELISLLNDNDNLNADDYTASTWAEYFSAYSEAKSVFVDGDATQKEVDDAVQLLNDTKAALKKVDLNPTNPTNPTTPTNPTNPTKTLPTTGEKKLSMVVVMISALLVAFVVIVKKRKTRAN